MQYLYKLSFSAKKLKTDGATSSELQQQGSTAYQQLSPSSKEKYVKLAGSVNSDLPTSTQLPKEKMIRRII